MAASVPVLAAYGCSSDESKSPGGGGGQPDPGGTFGLETNVRVVGAGRVSADLGGIDCPGTCGKTLIFDPAATGAKEVTLKATASEGWRFAGWTFDAVDIPAHGRGADNCQPILRKSGTPPGVNAGSPEVKLPAGEVDGAGPAGQSCADVAKVPLAYAVQAKFEPTGIVDAGPDGGGEGTPIFTCPSGAVGKKLFHKSGRLFWQCDQGSTSQLVYGSTSNTGTSTSFVGSSTPITLFHVDAYSEHAIYGNNGQLLARSTASPTGSDTVLSTSQTCNAITADVQYAYCRTGTTLMRFTLATGSPTQIASGLPTGNDLSVDSSNAAILFYSQSASPGSVYALPLVGLDGGTPNPTLIASNELAPSSVQSSLSAGLAFWLSGTTTIRRGTRSGGSTGTTVVSATNVQSFLLDPNSGMIYYLNVPAVGTASIERVSTSGGSSSVVKSGLTNPVALAFDNSYVYWMSGAGSIYRAAR